MNKPPEKIDNANVIYWYYSKDKPIFEMPITNNNIIKIYGLAICKYETDDKVYRFSCDKNWKVINDWDFDSMNEALNGSSSQYDINSVKWIKF